MTERRDGESEEAALVRAVAHGSEEALAALYDRHVDGVHAVALRLTSDRQVAEEVVQETFLALWNRAELFDPSLASLATWLRTIARNRTVDRLRAAGRRPPLVSLAGRGDARRARWRPRPVRIGRGGARRRRQDPSPEAAAEARRHPGGGRRGAGGDAGARTGRDRARVPRGADAGGDRRTAGVAARYREDAHTQGPRPPAGRTGRGRTRRSAAGAASREMDGDGTR